MINRAGNLVVHGTPLVAICEAVAALGFAADHFLHRLLVIEPPVHGVDMGEVKGAGRQQAGVLVRLEILSTVPVLHQLQSLNKLFGQCLIARDKRKYANIVLK